MRYRKLAAGAVFCGLLIVGTVSAQTTDPQMIAPIQQFMDTFNKGDAAGAAATHAAVAELVIIDELPPFQWTGPKAFHAWAADLDADAKARGITEPHVAISAPTRVESNGTAAYVIVPAVYTFKEKGVPMRAASQMTFVLKKGPKGWLIHGWTWTGARAQKAAAK